MDSKTYRLREFIRPADGRSLIVDTSAGVTSGVLPGLEDFAGAVTPVLPLVDGLITSPGQARHLAQRTRQDAALIVRADWTNALRSPDFVLPPQTTRHLPLLNAADALDLGASALVVHFLLGHEEEIEASCLKMVVQLAITGSQAGLPLLVDVQPVGPRVKLLGKAIELGVSYALEGGADGFAIPWPGEDSFQNILTMAGSLPVWVKPAAADLAGTPALPPGAAGLWIGAEVFALADPPAFLQAAAERVHAAAQTQEA